MTDVLPGPDRQLDAPARESTRESAERWISVCTVEAVDFDRGVAALVGGHAVAVFRLAPIGDDADTASDQVVAFDHVDPRTGAPTMARGLIGSSGFTTTVAAPIYKERYDVETGACLDNPKLSICIHEVRVLNGVIEVRLNVMCPKPSGNTDTTDSTG